jgi:hypothetical protein
MTRTALAERLLEQATAIAWEAAGLQELSAADIAEINTTQGQEMATQDERSNSMTPDETAFSRMNCIRIVFRHLGFDIGRASESKAIAVARDGSARICCLTSKDYETEVGNGERYWFTIYEDQIENIQRANQAYVAFGCGKTEQIVVVPADEFSKWTKDLPPYTQGKTGWHIHIRNENGKLELRREGRGAPPIDVTRFMI